jgi:hypothetical protein
VFNPYILTENDSLEKKDSPCPGAEMTGSALSKQENGLIRQIPGGA